MGRMPVTPRGRAPPEWTRPPEVNDELAPATAYHQAPTPTSRGFVARDTAVLPKIPLKSKFLDWATEVIPQHSFHHISQVNREKKKKKRT